MANTLPDSFTPRKFISMTNTTSTTAIPTRYASRAGKAETICATPEEMDTATVKI
jgi:hypothetical protein